MEPIGPHLVHRHKNQTDFREIPEIGVRLMFACLPCVIGCAKGAQFLQVWLLVLAIREIHKELINEVDSN